MLNDNIFMEKIYRIYTLFCQPKWMSVTVWCYKREVYLYINYIVFILDWIVTHCCSIMYTLVQNVNVLLYYKIKYTTCKKLSLYCPRLKVNILLYDVCYYILQLSPINIYYFHKDDNTCFLTRNTVLNLLDENFSENGL